MNPFSVRLVAFLVQKFPRRFRDRMGPDLIEAFADRRARILTKGGFLSRLRLLVTTLRTSFNLISSAIAEHLAENRLQKPEKSRPFVFSNAFREISTSIKSLVREPAFFLVALVTLALGIGANTAVFTVVNGVLLTPLPYPEPEQLVRVYNYSAPTPNSFNYLSGPDVVDLGERIESFSGFGALYTYRETGRDVVGPDGPTRITVLPVGADYFSVLGATPAHGRVFTPEEETAAPVVVLSHSLWTNMFDADGDIIGGSINLDGSPYTVVGIMRPGFKDALDIDAHAWSPLDLSPENRWNNRGNHYLSAVARIQSGVSLEQARAEVETVYAGMMADLRGEDFERQRVALVPLIDDVVRESDTTLFVLLGAAGIVLLIACVNVANLFLVRGVGRGRELALRAALGAGRARLIVSQLGEGLFVAIAGGVTGVVLAVVGVRALLGLSPDSLPRAEMISVDLGVLGFALIATLFTGVLFGVLPALQASRVDPNDVLKESTRSASAGSRQQRFRSALVVGQLALAVLLMTGAGLLMRSLSHLQNADLGVDASNVVTFELNLPDTRYGEGPQRAALHTELLDRINSLPGVANASAVSKLPAAGPYHNWGMGRLDSEAPEDPWIGVQVRVVQGDYFETFDIPLLRGRAIERTDIEAAEWVTVISRSAAEASFGEVDPIGKRVAIGSGEWTIVGVVEDVAVNHMGDRRRMVYLPHQQYAGNRNWALYYAVRADDERAADRVLGSIRGELAEIDSELVLYRAETMANIVGRQRARQQFSLVVMGIFAAVALCLGAVGIYGVLLYSVSERSQEIGIRLALGATNKTVIGLVMKRVVLLAGAGLAIGTGISLGAGRVLEAMLFEVGTRDAAVFTTVPVVLALVVLAAAAYPLLKALSVSPVEVLRQE